MLKKFLLERLSWILFVLFLQLLIIVMAYLDSTISLSSILYFVFLAMLIFSIFLMIRYQKESQYYKSLQEWETHLDLTNLPEAHRPFEKIIEDSLSSQTVRLKQESSQHLMTIEQEKDDLLAWIHEVKTPLTAMHLIIERIEDETLKRQLKHEWLRIHLLLDTQLHQRRIPFMENDLFVEHADLQALIFTEIKALLSWCIPKGIGFDVDLKVKEVLTDTKWLSFIIRQLLTNAVKYSDYSDINVKSFQEEGKTKLEVTDYGRGIDAKDLPRIFDKGFTSTTKHADHAATGMGLFLAKKAARTLHISIDVTSKLGQGTTFTLTFPKSNEFVRIAGM